MAVSSSTAYPTRMRRRAAIISQHVRMRGAMNNCRNRRISFSISPRGCSLMNRVQKRQRDLSVEFISRGRWWPRLQSASADGSTNINGNYRALRSESCRVISPLPKWFRYILPFFGELQSPRNARSNVLEKNLESNRVLVCFSRPLLLSC